MEITTSPAQQLAQPATGAATAASAISSDFETFLKMLTVQMQNQNPLDPIKSEDFAVQLATFSGVEQQVQTNDLLQSLAAQMNVMGMGQLAGWVGMEARAPVAGYFDGDSITLSPNPRLVADTAVLVVRDASGAEVQRAQIPASSDPVAWNGVLANGSALPHGLYDFAVESYADGALVASDTVEIYARIVEARSEGGETVLVTEGGAKVPAALVSGLREPGTAN
ncbi:MAG: flagellar hook assembly protein FlgD [Rhodobacter sp.]|nr:flagellar hook assembly protein FlgD [Rhodobacter sp.]